MLKSGIYDVVICRGGTDICFVLGFERKCPDVKQYRISGLIPLLSVTEPCSRPRPGRVVQSAQARPTSWHLLPARAPCGGQEDTRTRALFTAASFYCCCCCCSSFRC